MVDRIAGQRQNISTDCPRGDFQQGPWLILTGLISRVPQLGQGFQDSVANWFAERNRWTKVLQAPSLPLYSKIRRH